MKHHNQEVLYIQLKSEIKSLLLSRHREYRLRRRTDLKTVRRAIMRQERGDEIEGEVLGHILTSIPCLPQGRGRR